MDLAAILTTISIAAIPLVFAITVHEVAHGWVAKQFGDRTAEMLGRLTLNPIRHVDPIGTILVPGILLLSGSGFMFGWAKPVPVDARNMRNPRGNMILRDGGGSAVEPGHGDDLGVHHDGQPGLRRAECRANGSPAWRSTASSSTSCSPSSTCCRYRRWTAGRCSPTCCRRAGQRFPASYRAIRVFRRPRRSSFTEMLWPLIGPPIGFLLSLLIDLFGLRLMPF